MNTPSTDHDYDHLDISSAKFWSLTARERASNFEELRRERPVSFHPPTQGGLVQSTHGFWAIVRHNDIRDVSRNSDIFCSGRGVMSEDFPPEVNEASSGFLPMDDPRHAKLRGLVSRAFTPARVKRIESQINSQAKTLVQAAVETQDIDVVRSLSEPMPLWTISEMLGVSPEQRPELADAATILTGTADPDIVPPGEESLMLVFDGLSRLQALAHAMQTERSATPRDDLMSALVHAELDGHRLSPEEICGFVVLLSVAGNDTTRNTISHAVKAFADNPDQWDLLRSDPDTHLGPAVEEMLRWGSAIIQFRRTATCDTEIAGTAISEGDRVVMFYESGNRDETVFDRPWTFDITRQPNAHIAFGGGGAHFCLGAAIARAQLRAVFGELAKHVTAFEAGEPDYLTANFVHGVKRLPCHLQTR